MSREYILFNSVNSGRRNIKHEGLRSHFYRGLTNPMFEPSYVMDGLNAYVQNGLP